jgi:dinuclear metal center YbgI/SA1388 family protein
VTLSELTAHLDAELQASAYRDYGPNGLQVEGRGRVAHIVTGVTASQALIEQAVAQGADAVLVHHGLFWRGQDGRVTGWMKRRLGLLLAHDISLLAYHLPLDAHPSLGNNAQLAQVLGLEWADGPGARFGEQNLGFLGACEPASLSQLADRVQVALGRTVTVVGPGERPVRRVAWCTGGAQSYFEAAIAAGADAFITGELSEPQTHYAREAGVGYIACGHHASERYGVKALGEHLARRFGLRHTFMDIDNPA